VNPLTRRDVLAHQAVVPWPNQHQVEQDLLLCRAMAALFNDKFSAGLDCHARRHFAAQGTSRPGLTL
jgi:hypothetical protein